MTERELLAAEHALRLLEGEELLAARRLEAEDAAFAAEVRAWEERFAPLFDIVAHEPPPAGMWERIARRLEEPAGGELVVLRQKLARWRAGAIAAAIAASVLLLLQVQPRSAPPVTPPAPAQQAPMLLASLASENGAEALTLAYRPGRRELMVNAARLSSPAGRSRELWIIPAGAKPISLGVVAPGEERRRTLNPAMAARFQKGATIAISDEPEGGSPGGQPTGDVLVAGNLLTI